jgi:lysophospholipase L1-like esterase
VIRRAIGVLALLVVMVAVVAAAVVVGAGTGTADTVRPAGHGPGAGSGHSARHRSPPPFDLAVGGSGSVGFQPTWAHPHGQATDDGYADVLAAREASRWPGLTLVRIGCPGMTTQTMIGGGGHCAYRTGSQLETALAFLHTHPSTVLVTVDLGFNDLLPCLHAMRVNVTCVDVALGNVRTQLPQILRALRRAAPAHAHLVGIGHYDPYLGDATRGTTGHTFATASLGVIVRLNSVLRTAYARAGMPMADVGAAFDLRNRTRDRVAGLGTVPIDVARTCSLTWMCAAAPLGPNSHPNDAGYRVVAGAIAATLPPLRHRHVEVTSD